MRSTLPKVESAVRTKNCNGSYAIAHGLLRGNYLYSLFISYYFGKEYKKYLFSYAIFYFVFQGLGKLAEKFPNIAGTSISYLRDFLVDPSPILAKLYSQAQQKKDKEAFKIVGKHQQYFDQDFSP